MYEEDELCGRSSCTCFRHVGLDGVDFASRKPVRSTDHDRRAKCWREWKAALMWTCLYRWCYCFFQMAGKVDTVDQLSEMLREKSYPAAQKELEELKAYAKDKGHEGDVELWDVTYW